MSSEHINLIFACGVALWGAVWSVGNVNSKADVAIEKSMRTQEQLSGLDGKMDKLIEQVAKINAAVEVINTKIDSAGPGGAKSFKAPE